MGFSEKGIQVRLSFPYERCGRLELTMIVAHLEESLLVIRGLGIQTSTSSNTYLSKATTRFIPTTQIQDIVIHEAFKGFEVRFYLAVIVEGEPNVVVVFPVGLQLDCNVPDRRLTTFLEFPTETGHPGSGLEGL